MSDASSAAAGPKKASDAYVWGQIVVGPPGAGKTTYCAGMQQFLGLAGRRVAVINLDPANDSNPSYTPAVDIGELISLDAVQEELGLGPNGGLVYCLDYLEKNLDWLQEQLAPLEAEGYYLLFDLPGQVELFTLHSSLRRIVDVLTRKWRYRLTAVQLVDAHLCSDPAKYLSALLLSLSTMLHLELPQVNVLSKMDLIEQYGELAFSLDFYLQAQGLSHLAEAMEGTFPPKFQRMTEQLCEVIEDFGLLSFHPLAIEDRESVRHLVALIDKSNGYVFAGLANPGQPAPELQYSAGVGEDSSDLWDHMQERYVRDRDLRIQERQPPPGGEEEQQQPAGEEQPPREEQQPRDEQQADGQERADQQQPADQQEQPHPQQQQQPAGQQQADEEQQQQQQPSDGDPRPRGLLGQPQFQSRQQQPAEKQQLGVQWKLDDPQQQQHGQHVPASN